MQFWAYLVVVRKNNLYFLVLDKMGKGRHVSAKTSVCHRPPRTESMPAFCQPCIEQVPNDPYNTTLMKHFYLESWFDLTFTLALIYSIRSLLICYLPLPLGSFFQVWVRSCYWSRSLVNNGKVLISTYEPTLTWLLTFFTFFIPSKSTRWELPVTASLLIHQLGGGGGGGPPPERVPPPPVQRVRPNIPAWCGLASKQIQEPFLRRITVTETLKKADSFTDGRSTISFLQMLLRPIVFANNEIFLLWF